MFIFILETTSTSENLIIIVYIAKKNKIVDKSIYNKIIKNWSKSQKLKFFIKISKF